MREVYYLRENSLMSSINPLTHQQIATPRELRASPGTTGQRGGVAAPAEEEAHTPAPEFVRMMDIIRQIPQVRQEVVGEVARRLAGGELQTPEAMDATVQAILSAELPSG